MAMDINYEARSIIHQHTNAFMSAANYEPESEVELLECMLSECAFILTEDFIKGKYKPMEYNAIRNEIAKILNGIFSTIA